MIDISAVLEHLGSPVEVLERHGIPTRRRMARCPFHEDHEPSLSCFKGKDGRERWKCHGCNISGDAIDLEARLSKRTAGDVIREYGDAQR